MKASISIILVSFFFATQGHAQNTNDSTKLSIPVGGGKLSIEGYVDTYFSYSFNHPQDATHPYFVSYTRDNEVNIDLAFISLKYESDRVRARLTPGYGTYMNANYSSERQTLQNLVEAYVGVKLFQKKGIWLDMGVIPSPYTNESAAAFDQPVYTRSIGSENVPYYLTGARLTLPLGDKWTAFLYLLNGWQVIQAQHDPLDFGSQLEFKPDDKWDINWNTYIGNESSTTHPDYKTRYFSDLYAIYSASPAWSFTADAYSGWQQVGEGANAVTHNWWNAALCAKYTFVPGHSFSARVEKFHDPYQVLVTPVTPVSGFRLSSASLGYNWAVTDQVQLRLEGRYFKSPDNLYPLRDGSYTDTDAWLTVGITARFR
jgi:hypothetical protein